MFQKVTCGLATLFLALALQASAKAADFGPLNLGDVETFSQPAIVGPASYVFTFDLQSGSGIDVLVENVVFQSFLDIEDESFSMALFSTDGPETQIGPTAFASGGVMELAVSGLATGNYLLRVNATGTGLAGGLFAGALAVVPLPPSVMMLLSALATFLLFGRIGMRRAAS